MDRLRQLCNSIQFVNLSVGALGVCNERPSSLIRFLSNLSMNKKERN